MPSNKWRGFARIGDVANQNTIVMTVCPGNPLQEGSRFEATVQACAATFTDITIINAGALGYFNFRRYIPRDIAMDAALSRATKWNDAHIPVLEKYMSGKFRIIPIESLMADPTYEERVDVIRKIYERGNNPVSTWFDTSIAGDLERKSDRKNRNGVSVEDWALKEDALDYLCAEYAMRSLLREKYGLHEAYVGRSVYEPDLFQSQNDIAPHLDLSIPPVIPISVEHVKVQHDKKSGNFTHKRADIPDYADGLKKA